MKAENGRDMLGNSMVVEWAKGKSEKRRFGDRGGGRYGDRDRRGADRRGGDRGGPRGGGGCFNCGERGHIVRDCRSGGSRSGGNGGGRDRRDRERDSRRSRDRSRSRDR